MRLISTENGQSLQLLRMDEVRPLERGPFLPDLIDKINKRYRFAKPPAVLPSGSEPMKFEVGVMEVEGSQTAIKSLEIFHDGIIVNTRHTDDSDAVLNDFFHLMMHEFGFREPKTHIPRKYSSQVIVELHSSIDKLIHNLKAIKEIFSDSFARSYGERREFHAIQLAMSADPSDYIETLFRIEMRQNIPFAECRYFSYAPVSTTAHLDTLAAVERILIAD